MSGEIITLTPTNALRWVKRTRVVKLDPFYRPNTIIEDYMTLEQGFQGSDGSIHWRPIPTVDQTATAQRGEAS